ncbi:MAG: TonB family protein [Zoogloeaceae bacterium]|jgi:protein TonB|nr:TonB family protein [Zoogloeaceae bacterium]
MSLGLRLSQFAQAHSLGLAFAFSFFAHALPVGQSYFFPGGEPRKQVRDRGLEVILVNSKSASAPNAEDVQALAQTNLEGGGNTGENRRVATPLPPNRQTQTGDQLEQTRRRTEALEAQKRELTAASSSLKTRRREKDVLDPQSAPPAAGEDLLESARAMARLEGEIARNTDAYNKRPRKVFIGARTQEYRFAQYIEDWRQKVERWGALNYPEAARGKLYGALVLTVTLDKSGSILDIHIDHPSPHSVLNDAAYRIVKDAGPYAPFPPAIARDTDQVVITRTWTFTRGNSVETR